MGDDEHRERGHGQQPGAAFEEQVQDQETHAGENLNLSEMDLDDMDGAPEMTTSRLTVRPKMTVRPKRRPERGSAVPDSVTT